MSVKEYWEEECRLCGAYHCNNYFCYNCFIRYAVEAGADRAKLHQRIDALMEQDYILALKFRIKRVAEEPDREDILREMYLELKQLEEKGTAKSRNGG